MVICNEIAISLTGTSPTVYASKACAFLSWSFGIRERGHVLQSYEHL